MKKLLILLAIIFLPIFVQAETVDDIWVIETGGEGAFVSLLGETNNVTTKTTDEIIAGIPDDVELLIYPGGLAPISQAQDDDLQQAIRDFVSSGGGYFGSCGGSIPGSEELTYNYGTLDMIGLLPVNSIDYLEWLTISYTDGFIFNDNELNGEYASGTHWLSYTGGPAFDVIAGHESEVEVLATFAGNFVDTVPAYEVSGKAAIVTGQYGDGKVVLSAPHPESYAETQFIFDNLVAWAKRVPDYTPAVVENLKIPKKSIKAQKAKIKWDTVDTNTAYAIKLMNKKGEKIRLIKINENVGEKIIKNLKSGKKYKIKIRAKREVDGVIYKSEWSEIMSFKTK
jgi:glutamine amidotransferase-like uncharacterized protein